MGWSFVEERVAVDLIEAYMAMVALLAGMVVGSFLNVVIHRLPAGESLVAPGSHCPKCGHPVRWYHNVPVIGWLLLGGRCYDCGTRIPLRYPLIESLTGAGFLVAYLVFGVRPELIVAWGFLAALIAVAFIDLDHFIIPNRIVLPGAVIGVVASLALHPERWWEYLLAGLGAAGFLLIIALLWPGGMGAGDIKLALMMGFVLGRGVLVAMFLSFLVGGLVGIALLALKLKGRKDRIPFGPYLALGAATGILAGQQLLDSYLSLYG